MFGASAASSVRPAATRTRKWSRSAAEFMRPFTCVAVPPAFWATKRVSLDSMSASRVIAKADFTAALAFTMPLPHRLQGPGKGRVVDFNRASTWSGVSAGLADSISAATPATCGAAHRRALVGLVVVVARA